jgi:hypothetical protein
MRISTAPNSSPTPRSHRGRNSASLLNAGPMHGAEMAHHQLRWAPQLSTSQASLARSLLSLPATEQFVARLHAQRWASESLLQLSRRAVVASRRLLQDARTRITPPLYVRQIQRLSLQ